MTNPAIEQAVKAIETGIEKLCKLGNGEHDGNSDGNVIAQSLRQHLTSLRALTEPSKTDEELARELADKIAEDELTRLEWITVDGVKQSGATFNANVIEKHITQAFTAIRAQVFEELEHNLAKQGFFAFAEIIRKLKATK